MENQRSKKRNEHRRNFFLFSKTNKQTKQQPTNYQLKQKMPRLSKGSEEARQRMAHLRSLRKKKMGGSIEPVIPMAPVPKDLDSPKAEITGKGAKTAWVKHVAEFAHKNNMNYFTALKDPKVKEGYTKK